MHIRVRPVNFMIGPFSPNNIPIEGTILIGIEHSQKRNRLIDAPLTVKFSR
jgi:hypothetical protein